MDRTIVFGLLLASVLFLGCIGGQEEQNLTNQTAPAPQVVVKTPSFTVSSPAAGQAISIQGDTGDVQVRLSYQDLVLKSPGGAAKKGEGHFRIVVDNGQPITVASSTYTMPGLAVGTHTLKVELLNNDRTRYSPPISREVTFTIEREKPAEYVPVNYNVTINNFEYTPAEISAIVGDTITFYNAGNFPMSATCFIDGKQVFDTKVLAYNQLAVITLDREMQCTYYSTTQRAATGTVIVQASGMG
jgi:plastocyanin